MSFGIQSTGAYGGTSSAYGSSGSSLQPFANLDLTEQQRKQIRQIFQTAQSQGTSQSDVQSQINAILTPTQQQQFQTDLQSQAATSTSSQSQSGQGAPPNPFAGLNLTSSQQSQIQQILQTAQSQGTSQSSVQSQINAVLTPAQQQQLQANLQQLGFGSGSTGSSSSSSSTLPPIFANLNLTAAQQTQIQSILSNAQSQGLSPDQVQSEISSVLTTTQSQQLQQNVQNAQANNAGQGTWGPDAGSSQGSSSSTTTASTSSATLPNGLTASDIQKQIAAALSVLLQQIESEIGGTASSGTTSSSQGTADSSTTTNSTAPSSQGSSDSTTTSSTTTASTSDATLPNGLTASDIQKQIAAGLNLLFQQIQNEIGAATSATTSST